MQACLHPLLLGGVLFCHWWAVWFTLGRNFSTTLMFVICSRTVGLAGAWALVASGALGRSDSQLHGNWVGFSVAFAATWLWFWAVESAVLARLMQRMRRHWKWRPYDLAVLGIAHLFYLTAAAFLA
jgi:hypothetical protein